MRLGVSFVSGPSTHRVVAHIANRDDFEKEKLCSFGASLEIWGKGRNEDASVSTGRPELVEDCVVDFSCRHKKCCRSFLTSARSFCRRSRSSQFLVVGSSARVFEV